MPSGKRMASWPRYEAKHKLFSVSWQSVDRIHDHSLHLAPVSAIPVDNLACEGTDSEALKVPSTLLLLSLPSLPASNQSCRILDTRLQDDPLWLVR